MNALGLDPARLYVAQGRTKDGVPLLLSGNGSLVAGAVLPDDEVVVKDFATGKVAWDGATRNLFARYGRGLLGTFDEQPPDVQQAWRELAADVAALRAVREAAE